MTFQQSNCSKTIRYLVIFFGKRECHVTSITDSWVLVYHKSDDNRLYLHGTGTHADVFG